MNEELQETENRHEKELRIGIQTNRKLKKERLERLKTETREHWETWQLEKWTEEHQQHGWKIGKNVDVPHDLLQVVIRLDKIVEELHKRTARTANGNTE